MNGHPLARAAPTGMPVGKLALAYIKEKVRELVVFIRSFVLIRIQFSSEF